MATPADDPAMMSDKHIRFDEFEDVLASVELVALLAPFVRQQPQYWKWIIVGAHSALQGAMVCAYVDSSGTSILKKKPQGKKPRGKKPRGKKRKQPNHEEQLADFEDLLKCCVRGSHTCEPLVLTYQQRRDIRRSDRESTNNCIHFIPQGWDIGAASDLPSRTQRCGSTHAPRLCDTSPGRGPAGEIAGEVDGRAGGRERRSALKPC